MRCERRNFLIIFSWDVPVTTHKKIYILYFKVKYFKSPLQGDRDDHFHLEFPPWTVRFDTHTVPPQIYVYTIIIIIITTTTTPTTTTTIIIIIATIIIIIIYH